MTKEPMVYLVHLKRTDKREPIELIKTDNRKEAIEVLDGAEKEWTESSEQKRPFKMKQPIYTVFLSSLIYEIEVLEMPLEDYKQREFIQRAGNEGMLDNLMNTDRFGR